MKFRVNKKGFEKVFQMFDHIVESSVFFKEYKGISFNSTHDKLILVVTNGDIGGKAELDIEDSEVSNREQNLLIPYAYLKDVIAEIEGDDITIQKKGGLLAFSDGNTEFRLHLMYNITFPRIDFSYIGPEIKISAKELKTLIDNTAFAAAPKNEELVYCASNITLRNRELTFVATDSFRLAIDSTTVDNDQELDVTVLARNLSSLVAFEYEGDIIIHLSRYKISVIYDNVVLQTKVLDLPFKDFKDIFPKNEELTRTIFIDKDDLLNQLSKISVTLDEKYRKAIMWTKNEKLFFMSSKDNVGEAECKTARFKTAGKPFHVALDLKFLKEAVQPFTGEIIVFINDALNRIVIVSKSRISNKQLISLQRNERPPEDDFFVSE